jgi:hypothetical protein
MTKIEEVARAICRQAQIDDGYSEMQADSGNAQGMWRNFRQQARAAVEALREPIDSMLDIRIMDQAEEQSLREDWRAMIDAILNEKEPK